MIVVFLHPDLGIGGAERLVVDAALALKAHNHDVSFVTAHHNPEHCFSETKDGTLEVTVAGDWLPRSLLGRCYALCAYIRMIFAAIYLVLFSGKKPDLIFCDQISACIPVLRLFSSAKILFYCHFPDQLLTHRNSILKRIYRAPIDWIEEKTTGFAHRVLVNSNFTANVFRQTFKSLDQIDLQVLYPCLNLAAHEGAAPALPQNFIPSNFHYVFLSINRFERKKAIDLALHALALLETKVAPYIWNSIHLVIAGGYDERVVENRDYYNELCRLSERLNLVPHVTFVRSCSDDMKRALLANCFALLYTPTNEHFGIVPVEAMYYSKPVIAVNTGGPLETVQDRATGFLLPAEAEQFCGAMKLLIDEPSKAKIYGQNGHRRVVNQFSFEAFADRLNGLAEQLVKPYTPVMDSDD